MHNKLDATGETGLQFYGKITASVSHEIKNVLAIINENAGLLEDFTFMAYRGKPLDPARMKMIAAAVKKQIGRADGIIKNMNLFAHSVDQTITTVDLNETLELIIALTARFAAMRGVQVDLQSPENPVKFQTAPFFLINLVWLCLDFSMSVSGDEKRVALVVKEAEKNFQIRFRNLTGLNEKLMAIFPSDCEKSLLEMLSADLTVRPDRKEIVLQLYSD